MRFDLFFFCLFYLFNSSPCFFFKFNTVTVVAALGIITTPAIKSLQTNLISPSQIGQLLGGISVIDSLLRIIVPPIFDNLYALLVKTSPGSIWHCISVLLFIAFFVSFGIGPPL